MGILEVLLWNTALVRIALLPFNSEPKLLQLPLLDGLSFLGLILYNGAGCEAEPSVLETKRARPVDIPFLPVSWHIPLAMVLHGAALRPPDPNPEAIVRE
jgi:hypothetical protein